MVSEEHSQPSIEAQSGARHILGTHVVRDDETFSEDGNILELDSTEPKPLLSTLLDLVDNSATDAKAEAFSKTLNEWFEQQGLGATAKLASLYFFFGFLINSSVPRSASNFDFIYGKHLDLLQFSMVLTGIGAIAVELGLGLMQTIQLYRKGAKRTAQETRQMRLLMAQLTNNASAFGFYFASVLDQPLAQVVDRINQTLVAFPLAYIIFVWVYALDVAIKGYLWLKARDDLAQAKLECQTILNTHLANAPQTTPSPGQSLNDDDLEALIDALTKPARSQTLPSGLFQHHGKFAALTLKDEEKPTLAKACFKVLTCKQEVSISQKRLLLASLGLGLLVVMTTFPPAFGIMLLGLMTLTLVGLAVEADRQIGNNPSKACLKALLEQYPKLEAQQKTNAQNDQHPSRLGPADLAEGKGEGEGDGLSSTP